MAVWMIRAGRRGEHEALALAKGMAFVGWDEIPDLTLVKSRAELSRLFRAAYPEVSSQQAEAAVNQLWSFGKKVAEGDLVVLPLQSRPKVVLGEVTGLYEHLAENPAGARHSLAIKWKRREIPRGDFDPDLLYSLTAEMAVCRLQRNNAEERIRAMMAGKHLPVMASAGRRGDEASRSPVPANLEAFCRDQIRQALIRRFADHELVYLVTEILRAGGYHPQAGAAASDGAIPLIGGQGPLGLDAPRIHARIHLEDAELASSALTGLLQAMKNSGADQGLLVCPAGFRKTTLRAARKQGFKIRLWDAAGLLEAVLDAYDQLPQALRARLPLKRIWCLEGEAG